MAMRRGWLVGVLVPLEVAVALLVAGLPRQLAVPNLQTCATNPGSAALARTPTSTPQPEITLTPTIASAGPTPSYPESSPTPTATATPTPSPSSTPAYSPTAQLSPATSTSETPSPVPSIATPLASVVANTGGEGVNLRRSPSTSSARLRTIPEGAIVVATGPSVSAEGYVWYPVRDSRETSGWIQARYLTVRWPI